MRAFAAAEAAISPAAHQSQSWDSIERLRILVGPDSPVVLVESAVH